MLRNRPKYRGKAEFNADMTKAAKRAQGWYVSPALPTITARSYVKNWTRSNACDAQHRNNPSECRAIPHKVGGGARQDRVRDAQDHNPAEYRALPHETSGRAQRHKAKHTATLAGRRGGQPSCTHEPSKGVLPGTLNVAPCPQPEKADIRAVRGHSGFDPYVWSGRAGQEVSSTQADAVLHQCIRPLIGALSSRPSWISARVRSD